MDSYTIKYEFSQEFDAPARETYEWCTDYQPEDLARMGERGTREIERINEDTIILRDSVEESAGLAAKERLVRLHPGKLSWTSTHLSGPNIHSQFWYSIVGVGSGRSKLDFTGLQVFYGTKPNEEKLRVESEALRKYDAEAWGLLAKDINKEIGGRA